MKIKENIQTAKTTVEQIIKGAENLVLAVSIVIVSFYNIYDLLNRSVGNFEYYTRATASVVVALVGAVAIAKVLKQLGESK